jgi:hypothetical protein
MKLAKPFATIGKENQTEHRERGVERRVGERKRLTVGLEGSDVVQVYRLRATAELFEHSRREVDPDDATRGYRCLERQRSGSGADVEHLGVGRYIGKVEGDFRESGDLVPSSAT